MRPLDYEPTIPNLLARAAAAHGDGDFVVTPTDRLSFAGADRRSRVEAERLLAGGVGKGTRVGMLFPQGADFVVAFLAITRIGAVAVPLSTFLTAPELRRAVRHTDLDTLLVAPALPGRDPGDLVAEAWPGAVGAEGPLFLDEAPYLRRIAIGRPAGDGAAGPVPAGHRARVEGEVTPADHLVMIHTSGATAAPKAVVHTHGAQVRHSWALAQLYGITPEVRTFTSMPFFWVGGLTVTILTHLHAGAAVLTVERLDGRAVVDLVERERATRLVGWTLAERIRSDPALAGRDLSWLEPLLPVELDDAGRRHNSLGMSETGGPHSASPAAANRTDLPERLHGSFGPPVPGVEHRIVDPGSGEDLPEGREGEILVRGYSLMDGLYKHERAETFDPDGWYRTGDRGCLREGLLFFTGRLTDMIKTGGANVSPGEVEAAVTALAGVRAAYVVGVPDAGRGELVGCVVCPQPGHDLQPAALVAELRRSLSGYKVPRRIRVVAEDAVPWLPSGKVSRVGLVALLDDQ